MDVSRRMDVSRQEADILKEVNSFAKSYAGYELASSVCALIFITLVSLDVWKAFKRKASWIPGQALVLSALTIQLLLFIDHLDVSIHSSNDDLKYIQWRALVEEQLLIDTRRVMMCVFIAYLLPGMVTHGLKTVWGNVGTLALVVIAHMAYEAYFLLTIKSWELSSSFDRFENIMWDLSEYRLWLIPSYIALSLAIILLVVLLTCAVIAGKSIRNIVSQKVPRALSSCCNSAENRLCNNIEDHVLKSWIVVRVCQPDYIMARSVFTAFAGVVVTVCDVLLAVKCRWVSPPPYPMDITVYAIQFAFVVVGSMVVVFRWLTAVFYFPKDVQLEDFWTRTLVQQKVDLRGSRLYLSFGLTALLCVQKFMVSLSKICWNLSQFVFGIIRPFIKNKEKSDQFSKYEEVLELIRMPGENADSLWRANESAFEKTENHFKKGITDGESSSKLIDLIDHKTGTPKDEAPSSLEEEKNFKAVGKNSWKMRAVSLIHLIYETNSGVVEDCMEAYRQALDFMHMVDRSDPEAKLVSEAADNEFHTLENDGKKHGTSLHDSNDLKTVAARISLHKARNSVDPKSSENASQNLIQNLRCLLANVIFHCLEEEVLDKAITKNCNEWAEDYNEEEIFNAAYIAGKAKGVRQQVVKNKEALPV